MFYFNQLFVEMSRYLSVYCWSPSLVKSTLSALEKQDRTEPDSVGQSGTQALLTPALQTEGLQKTLKYTGGPPDCSSTQCKKNTRTEQYARVVEEPSSLILRRR